MRFYSTNNRNSKVSLRDAVIRGLAPDDGLYMPETIACLRDSFFKDIGRKTFNEIAFEVADTLLQGEVPEKELHRIIDHTIQFDAPIVEVEENVFSLELFHGPTLAFKDFGARFMSQLLGYFAQQQEREIVVLVATSGDTGSAVANGFLGVKGVKVVVLYPSGKVSEVQEKQFTTLGQNITALEVDGTFDDCQQLVKRAFQDEELRSKYFLTSANSINLARLIPQSFYYFYAYAQLQHRNLPFVFSVPSGNYGNLTGGLIAKRMGLPVERFIVATNANDVIPKYLETSVFMPRPSTQTISNAMDVGNPSNFARIVDLYDGNYERIKRDVVGYSVSDLETVEAMRNVFKERSYALDPHGAVAYVGLKRHLENTSPSSVGLFLETAHPSKFLDVVEKSTGTKIELPQRLQKFMIGVKSTIRMSSGYSDFKSQLERIL